MSRYVQLEPDGLFEYKWIGKKQEYRRRRVKRDIVLTYLRDRCDIVEGTTLRDIFRTVAKYKLLKAVIAQYSWCSHIDEFHAQAEEPMRRTDDQEPLDYLEIYYHPQIQKYKKEVSFDFYCGFHGIGPVPPDYEYANPGYITYSVSYSPMYELTDLPVKLNKEFKFYTPFDPGKKQKPDEWLLIDATWEYNSGRHLRRHQLPRWPRRKRRLHRADERHRGENQKRRDQDCSD